MLRSVDYVGLYVRRRTHTHSTDCPSFTWMVYGQSLSSKGCRGCLRLAETDNDLQATRWLLLGLEYPVKFAVFCVKEKTPGRHIRTMHRVTKRTEVRRD